MKVDDSPYVEFTENPQPTARRNRCVLEADTTKNFSDVEGYSLHKKERAVKKRVDVHNSLRETITPDGDIWAIHLSASVLFQELIQSCRKNVIPNSVLKIDAAYSSVLFCTAFTSHVCYVFKFGCLVGWDLTMNERKILVESLSPYLKDPETKAIEEDEMEYIWADYPTIKQDIVLLTSHDPFERMAYSYAFAQSVKLSTFETLVDQTIERTKAIPDGLAKTGTINWKREDISCRVGELFVQRFYINLHTDILDMPDIFWESDEFSEHYSSCRCYLEIPKRVDILNQRLDIIKDLYDMLTNELTIQHGNKLEWIVIYLICVEVVIELFWNILIKDIFKLV